VAVWCRADVRLGTGRIGASELNGCSAGQHDLPPASFDEFEPAAGSYFLNVS
jgi:hypothetical protein